MPASLNQGEMWEVQNDGLGTQTVLALCLDTEGYLYAGTAKQGVYRSSELFLTGTSHPNLRDVEVVQTYPNPSSGDITIAFALPSASRHVRLVIYDLLGRQVAVLLDDIAVSNREHQVIWHTEGLAKGTYFYRLSAGTTNMNGSIILAPRR